MALPVTVLLQVGKPKQTAAISGTGPSGRQPPVTRLHHACAGDYLLGTTEAVRVQTSRNS